MCGIAGCILNNRVLDQSIIDDVLNSLRHRGPDDSGFISGTFEKLSEIDKLDINDNISLIHTRLSINDLSSRARNPLTIAGSSVYVVFNGEIYNFRELRLELEIEGFCFETDSDTEVLLSLYLRDGDEFVSKLDGMFAIAIFDATRGQMKIFRDKFGIKPVYYLTTPDGFFFASEVKSLLKLAQVEASLDLIGLAQYLQFQNELEARTMFKDIELLLPGTFLTIDRNSNLALTKWWMPQIVEKDYIDRREAKLKLAKLLSDSVSHQLVGDVQLGSYLSGGIDSGMITSFASQQLPNIPSFTIGFSANNFKVSENYVDETEIAKKISNYLAIENENRIIDSEDFINDWVRTVVAIEDLRVGPSVQVLKAAELASNRCSVVLSGTGGDELFGGYPWRYPPLKLDLPESFDYWYRTATRLFSEFQVKDIVKWNSTEEQEEWKPYDLLKAIWDELPAKSGIDKALLMDLKIFLHGLLLVEDKLSMSQGIEVRVPMLSNGLIDFSLSLPTDFKVNGGVGKIILREVSNDLLPSGIPSARKIGFTPPISSWIADEIRERVMDFTFRNPKYLPEILDLHKVKSVLADMKSRNEEDRMFLWSLTSLEIWGRYYILGQSEEIIQNDLNNKSQNRSAD
jgi:asparagine synthase (glutamine-hydrolysing)